jgi:hypothetical protein
VAVAAKKKKRKSAHSSSQWGVKLAGIVLCAFFVLGVITGLSRPGHQLALRIHALLALWPHHSGSALIPDGFTAMSNGPTPDGNDNSVALVRRDGGFYVLDPAGDLRGPVAPEAQPDLPILSGPALAYADAPQLMRDAAVMVRAEAGLNHLISEMRVASDSTATLFLEHPQVSITIDENRSAAGIRRAVQMLHLWQGHQQLLAAIDLTASDEAVVRLKPAAFGRAGINAEMQKVAFTSARTGGVGHSKYYAAGGGR